MKRMRKIVALALIMMALFTLTDGIALALPPDNPHIESGSASDGGNFFEFDASYLGETGWRDLKTPPHWVVETGEVAYCLDHKAESPHNVAYGTFSPTAVYSDKTYKGLLAIMEHSYPYRYAGLTAQQIKYATANAIRSWLRESAGIGYDFMLPSNNAVRPKDATGQGAYNFYLQLLDKARNGSVVNQSLDITPEVVELELVDGKLKGTVTVEYGALNGKYKIDETKLSPGMSVSGYTGNSGDVLTFTVPIGMVGREKTLTDIIVGYDNRCAANIYWLDDSGGKQAVAVPVVDRMCAVRKGNVTLRSEPTKVIVSKKDSISGSSLKGARFGIYMLDDILISEITTKENGEAISGNLAFRDYYIKEIEAPEGYNLSDTVYTFTINSVGQEVLIDMVNDPIQGKVEITKLGDNGVKLHGAVFGIYDNNDNLRQQFTTDENGKALSNDLIYGEYYLKELIAPKGYVLNTETIPFTIDNNEEVIQLNVTNQIIRGSVRITKLNEEGNTLVNVIFGVCDDEDNLIEEITTDSEGIAMSSDLIYGNYYFKELNAPEGYIIDNAKYDFSIENNGELIGFEVINEKITGFAEIIKKDSETGKLLQGAVFEIYNKDGTVIYTLTTDENGYVKSIALDYGEYYIKEVTAPDGYVLNENEYPFFIANNNETKTIDISNDPIKGRVEIAKTESISNTPLKGVKFGIYAITGELIEELVTDNEGKVISSELRYGNYYVKEIKALDVYILGDIKYPISIVEDGEIIYFSIVNSPIAGSIEVQFRDIDHKQELKDPYIYSDWIGIPYLDGLKAKGLDNVSIDSYELIKSDYTDSNVITEDKQTIIYWYRSDESIKLKENTWSGVYIPKTGQAYPKLTYFLGILCFILAVLIIGISHNSVGGNRK